MLINDVKSVEKMEGDQMEGSDSSSAKLKAQKFNWPVSVGAFILFGGTLIAYVVNFGFKISDEHARWAEFGDFFGGFLNPVFGLAAFLALLYTIKLQSAALDLSSQELKAATKEVGNSTKALKSQNDSMIEQRIDATFFQLLGTHNEIVNALEYDLKNEQKAPGTVRGRTCFKYYLSDFEERYNETGSKNPGHDPFKNDSYSKQEEIELINLTYKATFNQFQAELGHYFRFLYNIFKYLDRDVADKDKQSFYAKLVRSQLSNYELALLFYNCQSDLGSNKFKPYVEQFALLKNLPEDLLLDSNHRRELYHENAWRSSL